jgi:hypothetical protein
MVCPCCCGTGSSVLVTQKVGGEGGPARNFDRRATLKTAAGVEAIFLTARLWAAVRPFR